MEPTGGPPLEREPASGSADAREFRFGGRTVLAVKLLVALAAGASAWTKIFDPDVWWYVRVGRFMWEHRALPLHDPFSFTGQLPYGSHPVLSELLFYLAHRTGDVLGLTVLRAVLLAALAAVVLTLALERQRPTPAELVAGSATLGLWYASAHFRLGPKPELFTYLGLGVVLLLLRAEIEGRSSRAFWAIPLLFAVWSNLHRGGVMALGLLGAAGMVLLVRASTRRLGWRVAGVTVLSVLASAANPDGIGYFTSTFSVMSTQSYSKYISEWAPVSVPFFRTVGKGFAVLGMLWIAERVRSRKLDVEAVMVTLATLAALKSVRLVPVAALVMVPGCARLSTSLVAAIVRKSPSVRPDVWRVLAVAVGVGAIAAKFVSSLPPSAWGSGVLTWRVPVRGVEFVLQHPPPGERMWNNLNYGGYLLFALAPEKRVFIDGRNDMVYAPSFYEETQMATTDPVVLRRQLDEHAIDFALVQSSGLVESRYLGLYGAPDFVPVYMDDVVTVMVRDTAASKPYLREHGYRVLRPHTAVPRAENVARDPAPALLELEARRNVAQAPDSIRAWYVLALVAKAKGDRDAYDRARTVVGQLASEREVQVELP